MTDVDVATSIRAFGLAAVVGSIVIGALADRRLQTLCAVAPLMVGSGAAAIAFLHGHWWMVLTGVVLWGAAFGGWLIMASEWIARLAPDRMEAGGGLVVAGFQLVITFGAGVGGQVVDHVGATGTFAIASGLSAAGGVVFALSARRLGRHGPISTVE